MTTSEQEARRAFVVEIDAILSEILVAYDNLALTDERFAATSKTHARLTALRQYVLNKFDQGDRP